MAKSYGAFANMSEGSTKINNNFVIFCLRVYM